MPTPSKKSAALLPCSADCSTPPPSMLPSLLVLLRPPHSIQQTPLVLSNSNMSFSSRISTSILNKRVMTPRRVLSSLFQSLSSFGFLHVFRYVMGITHQCKIWEWSMTGKEVSHMENTMLHMECSSDVRCRLLLSLYTSRLPIRWLHIQRVGKGFQEEIWDHRNWQGIRESLGMLNNWKGDEDMEGGSYWKQRRHGDQELRISKSLPCLPLYQISISMVLLRNSSRKHRVNTW